MNYEERIKELISKNNKLGKVNIKLNQTLKERNETIHNQTSEIKKLKNKVGELEYRLYKVYSS
uniref:Cell division protein n=1 Tax=Siphoviridae sp. ctxvK3 TaxID=2827975 RepID=A0A8S5SFZ2_9CAUD|nr:MAG TPA: cell division protein [Siphoviridae sp. ctxvK3]